MSKLKFERNPLTVKEYVMAHIANRPIGSTFKLMLAHLRLNGHSACKGCGDVTPDWVIGDDGYCPCCADAIEEGDLSIAEYEGIQEQKRSAQTENG